MQPLSWTADLLQEESPMVEVAISVLDKTAHQQPKLGFITDSAKVRQQRIVIRKH